MRIRPVVRSLSILAVGMLIFPGAPKPPQLIQLPKIRVRQWVPKRSRHKLLGAG